MMRIRDAGGETTALYSMERESEETNEDKLKGLIRSNLIKAI